MITIGLIIAAAAVALGLATRFRFPVSALAIAAGVVLQALEAPADDEVVQDGLLMAATFLVFVVGAELERRPLRRYQTAAFGLAVTMIVVTSLVGVALWATLGLDAWTATYWVVALTASSTLLVFELLRGRARLFEPIGRMVSATSLVQDVIVIVTLSVFAAFAPNTPNPARVLAGVAGLAVAAWLLSRWVAPFVMQRLGLDEEERLLFVLLTLFSFAAIARWTGGVLVTGAYFAGLSISRFPVGDLARGYLKSFSDFFTTIFYVMLGLVVTVPSPADVVPELVLVVAVLIIRPIVLLPLVRRSGLTVRSSIEAVTLLAQAGELAVIVAIVGMELGHIQENTFGTVVVLVAITTALAPWLSSDRVTWWLTHMFPFRAEALLGQPPSGHVVLLGCGETGAEVLAGLRAISTNVVVVDDDPGIVQVLADKGVTVVRGNGTDAKVLRLAGAQEARAIVSTMRRAPDNARLLSMVRGPTMLIRVFSEQEADQVRKLGGQPVIEAELAAAAFLKWHAEASAEQDRTSE